MTAYPDKALVTTWTKNDEGTWVKVKTLHKIDPSKPIDLDLLKINDEHTRIKSIEFLYGTER